MANMATNAAPAPQAGQAAASGTSAPVSDPTYKNVSAQLDKMPDRMKAAAGMTKYSQNFNTYDAKSRTFTIGQTPDMGEDAPSLHPQALKAAMKAIENQVKRTNPEVANVNWQFVK